VPVQNLNRSAWQTFMTNRLFAIVNPAAGGGRCGKLAAAALDRVRATGVELEIAQTTRAGEATLLARDAYERGHRAFLAVGGDGTSFEIVNGVFPESTTARGRVALGFLPLGTGNSFLRDFTSEGVEHTIRAIRENRRRPVDVIRLSHAEGDIYYINMLNLGFAADAGELANRRFKRFGPAGYIFGVFGTLAGLACLPFPHRLPGAADWDRRPLLYLALGNSKYTGGKMLMTPDADPSDGKIEYLRWSPVGPLRVLWTLPSLFTGEHARHPLASRAAVDRVDFDLGGCVNVIVDGEVMRLDVRSAQVLPGALDVIA
jgi:diacylglycerol kinase (ATP)